MSWAKFDDQYPDHPKIVEVGPLGLALHTAATCYCARYLTDGFVPIAMMGRLLNFEGITINNNAVTNKQVTDDLIRVGLLEVVPGGYKVHDYLEYNPPAAQVKAERAANKRRQDEFRARNAVSNALQTPVPSPSPSPSNTNGKGNGKHSSNGLLTTPEERIYCAVTNHPTIPAGSQDAVINAIQKIKASKNLDDNGAVDYLRPFWNTAKKRYTKSVGVFWLADWAVIGVIPDPPKPNGNGHNNTPPLRKVIKRDAHGNELEYEE